MEHLIRPEWFAGMSLPLLALAGGGAIYVLLIGADWLVAGASGLALRAGMSMVIIGATIVALGTTSPEAAVSVVAAWEGKSGLALGNAVGSVIADTGLIFGIGCLLRRLPVDRFVLNRQGWVQFSSAAILAVICYATWMSSGADATLGRGVGIVLVLGLAAYMGVSVGWGKQHPSAATTETEHKLQHARSSSASKMIVQLLIGLLTVIIASQVVVNCAEALARRWGVPPVVISSTVIAFGTSLPELVIGLTAVRRGSPELLIGNVIGADVLNILFVIGASALAAPLPIVDASAKVPEIFLYLHLPAMLVVLAVFRVYIFSAIARGHFRRWFGVPMLAIYVTFLILNWTLSTG